MQTNLLFVLTVICSASTDSLDFKYEGVLVSVFENLLIKQCLILEDFELPEASTQMYVKRFSKMEVATAVVSFKDFSEIYESTAATYLNTAVILHLKNDSQIELLVRYSSLITDISFTWMVLVEPGVRPFTNRIHVPIHCLFLIIEPVDETTLDINEFYSIRGAGTTRRPEFYANSRVQRKETLWGTWSVEAKLSVHVKEPFFRRRRDFNRFPLEAAYYVPGTAQEWFWTYTEEFYNFTSKFIKTDHPLNRSVIVERPIVGWIFYAAMNSQKGQKSSVAPLEISSDYLYVKRPTEEKSFWMSYIRPFTMHAWVLITIFASFIWILIPLLKITVLKLGVQSAKEKFDPVGYGCLTFDTLMGQSGMDVPSMTLSFRIAFFATICFSALLQSLYSGELISYLTIHEYPLPFSDVAEFVEDGTYNITYQKGSTMPEFVLEMDSGPVIGNYVRTHYTEYPAPEGQAQWQDLVNLVCKERVVFAGVDRELYWKALSWPCEIVQIPQPFTTSYSALFLDDEFASAFRYKLPWVLETATLKRFIEDMNKDVWSPGTRHIETPDLTEVDMPRIVPPLLFFISVITISSCVLLLELLHSWWYSPPQHIFLN